MMEYSREHICKSLEQIEEMTSKEDIDHIQRKESEWRPQSGGELVSSINMGVRFMYKARTSKKKILRLMVRKKPQYLKNP